NGEHYFDLSNWENGEGSGGTWEDWSVVSGVFNVAPGIAPNCTLGNTGITQNSATILPNPFSDSISISFDDAADVRIYDAIGKLVNDTTISGDETIDTAAFSSGFYIVEVRTANGQVTQKLVKM